MMMTCHTQHNKSHNLKIVKAAEYSNTARRARNAATEKFNHISTNALSYDCRHFAWVAKCLRLDQNRLVITINPSKYNRPQFSQIKIQIYSTKMLNMNMWPNQYRHSACKDKTLFVKEYSVITAGVDIRNGYQEYRRLCRRYLWPE